MNNDSPYLLVRVREMTPEEVKSSPQCPCAILPAPGGGFIAQTDRGTILISGELPKTIADFTAAICLGSLRNADASLLVHVDRYGQRHDVRTTFQELADGSWVAKHLGAPAAASVADHGLLSHSIWERTRAHYHHGFGKGELCTP